VVDHQIHRHDRVQPLRIMAQARQSGAHARQVIEHRHAGEVLQQHAPWEEGHQWRRSGPWLPLREGQQAFLRQLALRHLAQDALHEKAQRIGKPREARCLHARRLAQGEIVVISVSDSQRFV
jgi:hypothetical protein